MILKIHTVSLFFPSLGYEKRVDYYQPDEEVQGVIYFHDGQNVFIDENAGYGRSWRVKNFVENHPQYKKYAIVAIWHGTERLYEYGPWQFSPEITTKLNDLNKRRLGGAGFDYVKDLAEVVVPYFTNQFKTSGDNCLLVGSSMGGLISLVAGCQYPERFGKIAAISNALWCNEEAFFDYLASIIKFPSQVLVTYGDREAHGEITDDKYISPNQRLINVLKEKPTELKEMMVKGGRHHETHWEKLLPELFSMMEK